MADSEVWRRKFEHRVFVYLHIFLIFSKLKSLIKEKEKLI